MHCHICDREEELGYNKITKEFEPCSVCQAAIDECLEAFEDEDENGNHPSDEFWNRG